jgi:hypothetical protein
MQRSKLLFLSMLIGLILSGCGVADGGKVTARDVLKQDKGADIIQYNGFIFNNVTNLDLFKEGNQVSFSKEHQLGEIQKQTTSSWLFGDFSATQLPKETKVYSEGEKSPGILFVEYQGEELYYMQLLEG